MANNFFVPVAGVLLDWQGPRRTFFIGTFVFSLGALLFGLSSDKCARIMRTKQLTKLTFGIWLGAGSDGIGVDLHVLGAVLITTGGPLCFLSNIALSYVTII
jgi:MFS family permease